MTSRLQAKLLAQRALFQRLQSSKKRNKLQAGFTLVELLIVIAVIGILSAIAVPNFVATRDRATLRANEASATSAARACATALLAGVTGNDLPTAAGAAAGAAACADNTAITYGTGTTAASRFPQDDGTVTTAAN